jgi:L-aspartate oxidase
MTTHSAQTFHADVLVIGSGIAGLRAALEVAGAGEVVLLTKADVREGNTGYAQGGIAAAVGADDSPELHAADTIAAGDGLCDPAAVAVLTSEGPAAVRELIAWGAAFDRDSRGELALAREGAHSVRRVLHAADATGREIGRALWERVITTAAPRVVEHAAALDVIVRDGACRGVRFEGPDGVAEVYGGAMLLATGGAGQVFRHTTNPDVASGDGVAMAWHAGAQVADLEFVQFHPTALDVPLAPRFLLSEALRGEGARLVNEEDEAFMARYEALGDLAPRDRVSRAIVREAARTGGRIYLSLRHLEELDVHRRFPMISEACRAAGLDLARDRIPVSPAAHYAMGGVETDLDGRTSLPGLFAAGEVACTRVHGANRLASNSLLEGLVFGRRAGRAVREWIEGRGSGDWHTPSVARPLPMHSLGATARPLPSIDAVRDLMWNDVGLVRDGAGLARATLALETALMEVVGNADRGTTMRLRTRNVMTVAYLMAGAALRREESRGGHFRRDFPDRDDARWRVHVFDAREPVEPAGRAAPAWTKRSEVG